MPKTHLERAMLGLRLALVGDVLNCAVRGRRPLAAATAWGPASEDALRAIRPNEAVHVVRRLTSYQRATVLEDALVRTADRAAAALVLVAAAMRNRGCLAARLLAQRRFLPGLFGLADLRQK